MHDIVDLRSDTLTLPTPEMREAMARAEVGDDVWGEDPTIQRLESMAAERLGKEAGLFVTSGTQGNLVSVVAHTRSGQEVVLDLDSHIYNYEVAGAATVGHVQMRPAKTARGFLTPEQVREAIRSANIHLPQTGLVCVENTHNRHGGTCSTQSPLGLRKILFVVIEKDESGTARGQGTRRLEPDATGAAGHNRDGVRHVEQVAITHTVLPCPAPAERHFPQGRGVRRPSACRLSAALKLTNI